MFSAPMVRAILGGQKSQTRRVVKLPSGHMWAVPADYDGQIIYKGAHNEFHNEFPVDELKCPYGRPGDRLWVREAWAHDAESLEQCRASHEDAMGGGAYGPYYRATEVAPDTLRWRPSIHMPRWASRINLEVTGVRVERLQDISGADALAEGIKERGTYPHDSDPEEIDRTEYRRLWESINGSGSWAANPWVWVIQFKKVTT